MERSRIQCPSQNPSTIPRARDHQARLDLERLAGQASHRARGRRPWPRDRKTLFPVSPPTGSMAYAPPRHPCGALVRRWGHPAEEITASPPSDFELAHGFAPADDVEGLETVVPAERE